MATRNDTAQAVGSREDDPACRPLNRAKALASVLEVAAIDGNLPMRDGVTECLTSMLLEQLELVERRLSAEGKGGSRMRVV